MNVLLLSSGYPADMPEFTPGLAEVGARVFGECANAVTKGRNSDDIKPNTRLRISTSGSELQLYAE